MGNPIERAELLEAKRLESKEGRAYSYQFSMLVPEDFPVVPTRLVLASWKQRCPAEDCKEDNPVVALRYVGGRISVSAQTSEEKRTLVVLPENVKNKWLDFRFDIHFSRNRDGFLRVWLDGNQVVKYDGPTAYSDEFGYPAPSSFFFKLGLYRDRVAQPMTVFVDEYRKRELDLGGTP